MVDYIIVGAGLAGVSFAEFALQREKTILVYDNNSQPSSTVAGGMYNPVVLKRFTEIWKAKEQLEVAQVFYPNLEKKLNEKFDFPMPLWRKFASIEEQNNWFVACDKKILGTFLNVNLLYETIQVIDSPFGYGEVFNSGYLDIKKMVSTYQSYLRDLSLYNNESFDYSAIKFCSDCITYKGIETKNIVFAEGFGLHQNPFFNELPLDGTKGELLHIKCKDLNLDKIVKSNIFILPIGNDIYKVGATYNWEDKTNIPSESGKKELIEKLNALISCEYEVIEHLAGVRPTVKDRRPLVGTHRTHKNIHLLNGLGTRGVMLGPFLAKSLLEFLENDIPLDNEISIERFYKKIAK
jgi:glycine/D-amino acid oxidase-like deaminating enzyme